MWRLASTPQEAVNQVNSYLANIGKTLAENILGKQQQADFSVDSFFDNLNSFVLLDTEVNEVLNQISSLENGCAVKNF